MTTVDQIIEKAVADKCACGVMPAHEYHCHVQRGDGTGDDYIFHGVLCAMHEKIVSDKMDALKKRMEALGW